jgi:hypothetical protein
MIVLSYFTICVLEFVYRNVRRIGGFVVFRTAGDASEVVYDKRADGGKNYVCQVNEEPCCIRCLDKDSGPRPPACEASVLNLTAWGARKMKWI